MTDLHIGVRKQKLWRQVLEGVAADVGPSCLVTGGAGYLGRRLVGALVEVGCKVRVLDAVTCDDFPDGVEFVQGDVRDAGLVSQACIGIDTVFHTAAAMSFVTMAPKQQRERIHAINVGGTSNVIAACKQQAVGRLIYTSTVNVVFGGEILEADESAPYPQRFTDLYGQSKANAEQLVLAADDPRGLRTAALRPGGIWGDGDGGFMVLSFLRQMSMGRLVAQMGDGRSVVDNTHVYNLLRAQLAVAEVLRTRPQIAGGKAYFITDNERINGIEWFRPIVDALGYRFPRIHLPPSLLYGVSWCAEAAYLLGAAEPVVTRSAVTKMTKSSSFRIDRARADLAYEPLLQRDEGMILHMDDYVRTFQTLAPVQKKLQKTSSNTNKSGSR